MTFKDRLARLRKERGLSQEELAAGINVSRQAVSKWENGDAMPDVDKIISLADLFGVTIDWLLRGTQPKPDEPHPTPLPGPDKSCSTLQQSTIERFSPIVMCVGWCLSALGLVMMLFGQFSMYSSCLVMIGIMLQITSAIMPVACAIQLGKNCPEARADFLKSFWRVNIWFIALAPTFLVSLFLIRQVFNISEGILYWLYQILPYPLWELCSRLLFLLIPAIYIGICLFVSFRVCRPKESLPHPLS